MRQPLYKTTTKNYFQKKNNNNNSIGNFVVDINTDYYSTQNFWFFFYAWDFFATRPFLSPSVSPCVMMRSPGGPKAVFALTEGERAKDNIREHWCLQILLQSSMGQIPHFLVSFSNPCCLFPCFMWLSALRRGTLTLHSTLHKHLYSTSISLLMIYNKHY